MNKRDEKIKICGIKDSKILDFLIERNVNYYGLIFYENSPRFIDIDKALNLINISKNSNIQAVGVFVNMKINLLKTFIEKLDLKIIQLHGNEDDEFIKKIKKDYDLEVIKALGINDYEDIKKTILFSNADYFLFDYKPTKKNEMPGGNAKKFDWDILKNLKLEKKWFLSGGINIKNIKNALQIKNVYGFDISSGVEDRPGIKSVKKINELLNKINL